MLGLTLQQEEVKHCRAKSKCTNVKRGGGMQPWGERGQIYKSPRAN